MTSTVTFRPEKTIPFKDCIGLGVATVLKVLLMFSILERAKNQDAVGNLFKRVARTGTDVDIVFGKISTAGDVCWYRYPHSEQDGVGGFHRLLEFTTQSFFDPPNGTFAFDTSLTRSLRLGFRYVWTQMFRQTSNPFSPTAESTNGQILKWKALDPAAVASLLAVARSEGVTLNTLLLQRLDQEMRRFTLHSNRTHSWMIPVNLRGRVPGPGRYSNRVSFVAVDIKPDSSLQELHSQVMDRLNSGWHWFFWHAIQLSSAIPKSILDWIIRGHMKVAQTNTAAFSNLGRWPRVSGDPSQAWIFAPPVAKAIPVTIGCVTYDETMTVAIHCHPTSGLKENQLVAILNSIAPEGQNTRLQVDLSRRGSLS